MSQEPGTNLIEVYLFGFLKQQKLSMLLYKQFLDHLLTCIAFFQGHY